MAMSSLSRRTRSEINVTPLIDIVLVLLIIFIVLVPTLSRSLAVAIPQKPGGIAPEGPVPLVLSLDQAGVLRLQQDVVSLAELPERLMDPLLKQPMKLRKVFLKVDEDLPYERAVAVMDRVRLASVRVQAASIRTLGGEGSETKVVLAPLKKG